MLFYKLSAYLLHCSNYGKSNCNISLSSGYFNLKFQKRKILPLPGLGPRIKNGFLGGLEQPVSASQPGNCTAEPARTLRLRAGRWNRGSFQTVSCGWIHLVSTVEQCKGGENGVVVFANQVSKKYSSN